MSEHIYEDSDMEHERYHVIPFGSMREEIVRCRDCANYRSGITDGRRYTEPYCGAIGELAYGALFSVDENDFCAWAEPK
ncbi:MAG: hypothetical protein IJF97_00625 [Eggerthellaceae bacterium]|nr:hypothetical protein [Eggerthellaceae bacterium]MBQ3342704.1 hypothetical protein [Kiritimatiellia bacterium]